MKSNLDLWPLFWIVLAVCLIFESEIKERIVGHPVTISKEQK